MITGSLCQFVDSVSHLLLIDLIGFKSGNGGVNYIRMGTFVVGGPSKGWIHYHQVKTFVRYFHHYVRRSFFAGAAGAQGWIAGVHHQQLAVLVK